MKDNKPQNEGPIEISLDDIDLSNLDQLEGTALGNILAEFLDNDNSHNGLAHTNHNQSHSNHSSHGTVAW